MTQIFPHWFGDLLLSQRVIHQRNAMEIIHTIYQTHETGTKVSPDNLHTFLSDRGYTVSDRTAKNQTTFWRVLFDPRDSAVIVQSLVPEDAKPFSPMRIELNGSKQRVTVQEIKELERLNPPIRYITRN